MTSTPYGTTPEPELPPGCKALVGSFGDCGQCRVYEGDGSDEAAIVYYYAHPERGPVVVPPDEWGQAETAAIHQIVETARPDLWLEHTGDWVPVCKGEGVVVLESFPPGQWRVVHPASEHGPATVHEARMNAAGMLVYNYAGAEVYIDLSTLNFA